jgi:hypothetical protein
MFQALRIKLWNIGSEELSEVQQTGCRTPLYHIFQLLVCEQSEECGQWNSVDDRSLRLAPAPEPCMVSLSRKASRGQIHPNERIQGRAEG